MNEWKEYLDSIEETGTYKKRIRRYLSDRNRLLGKGGQKNSAPYTKRMGKHVTFDKQLEEAEAEEFQLQTKLQPDLWKDKKLDSEVRERLLQIANDFIDGLKVDNLEIQDIRFTGSLANYNWSRFSDIDLHIVVDFSKINKDTQLVKAFFDEARMRWNDQHRILLHDFEVEIYVENTGEDHKSTGVYSITNDEWIVEPQQLDINIDFETANKKAEDYKQQADQISQMISKGKDLDKAIDRVERVKSKIRDMRKAGLETEESEFSSENIAFKILRRDNVLKQLSDLKRNAYDKKMTLQEE